MQLRHGGRREQLPDSEKLEEERHHLLISASEVGTTDEETDAGG